MTIERARQLRKAMTEPERKLWRALRGRQLEGFRFRRQHPIGICVADFVCLEKRLVIEVDGGQHGEPAQIAHDARRTQWLEAEGYRVIRVWNRDVMDNLYGVVILILETLEARE